MAGPDIDRSWHLDAVQLSALVDDRAEPDARSHLAGCRHCRDRLASWRTVRGRVAALDDDRAQRMLDARRPDVVRAVTAGALSPGRRGRRRGMLIAAVVLVVGAGAGGAAALLSRAGAGGGTGGGAGPGAPVPGAPVPGASVPGASVPGGGAGPVAAALPTVDLGPLDGPAALASAAQRELSPPSSAPHPRSGGSGAGSAAAAGRPLRCLDPARSRAPAGSAAVLQGQGVYRSVPAQVFVFSAGAHRTAVVTASSGCRIIATTTL